MASSTTFNEVKNWGLKCFKQEKKEKAIILRCVKSGKKIEDGKYEDGIFIDVLVNNDTDWGRCDLVGKQINVDGTFTHSWWTSKDGVKNPTFTIFATAVKERE